LMPIVRSSQICATRVAVAVARRDRKTTLLHSTQTSVVHASSS
jgi:hypothetical protein